MRVRTVARRIARGAPRSMVIRILALHALLLTSGCTTMVLDAYRGKSMSDPIYVWGVDYEQPEIHLAWSRVQPPKIDEDTSDESGPSGTKLSIRPGLEGCDVVEVYMNDLTFPLSDGNASIQHWAIEADANLIPDERYPDCSVLLTYRRPASPQDLVLVAATKDGIVAEFPSGKRKPAWLLLMPLAAIPDAVLVGLVLAVVVLAP